MGDGGTSDRGVGKHRMREVLGTLNEIRAGNIA